MLMKQGLCSHQTSQYATWVELLRSRALAEPNALAFGFMLNGHDVEINYSYEDLDAAARKIGSALLQAGKFGERAVLLYQPGPDYICALMGCLYAGVVAVPVYAPRVNGSYEGVMQIAASAGAVLLLSTAKILATLNPDDWAGLNKSGLTWLATDTLPVELGDQWQMPNIGIDTLAILQFTSGSTGRPKGVKLGHRHLLTNSRMIARAMQCNRESVGVIWLPPYHDMGLIGGLLQPIYSGFPVHIMSPTTFVQRPLRWLEAITKYRGTISAAPNFAYELCAKRVRPEQLESLDLSSWQVAGNGAEPIRADTLRQFSKVFAPAGFNERAFFPCYGMAETTLYVTGSPHFSGVRTLQASRDALTVGAVVPVDARSDQIELVSSGAVDPEVAVCIVNHRTGLPCAPGFVGEIWVSGQTVAEGYWGHPEDTAQTFHARIPGRDGTWLRTGDLGSVVENELYVTGRIKDLIIIRGQNHYPHDIEATVSAVHPTLRAYGTAAFSVHGDEGEQLVVVQEIDRNAVVDNDYSELEAEIRHAIANKHQIQVSRIAIVKAGSIPKTSSGKTQRLLCRQLLLAGDIVPLNEASASSV